VRIESEIKKWGNSLALRITGVMADLPGLNEGTKVEVEVTKDSLVIKRAVKARRKLKLPYNEKELIAGLTPKKAHADLLPTLIKREIDL
jgi:antitoxin MazE